MATKKSALKRKPKTPDGSADYKIGYCKPPEHHQFKPGQSGNPQGPNSSKANFATSLKRALCQKRHVTIAGCSKELTSLEIIMMRQTEKAVAGDTKATQFVVNLAAEYLPDYMREVVSKHLDAEDLAIIDAALERRAQDGTKTIVTRTPALEVEDPST